MGQAILLCWGIPRDQRHATGGIPVLVRLRAAPIGDTRVRRSARCGLRSWRVSDNWIVLVAVGPYAVPHGDAIEAARSAVETACPDAEEVLTEVTSTPQFVDAGQNFEKVSCPRCGAELDLDWWQRAMDDAARTEFSSLEVVTPCCASATTLNDLNYDWPQAFARVSIHAMNPQILGLDAAMKMKVEQLLDLPTRVIYQHV